MVDGHSSAECPNVLCQAHAYHADKGLHVRGPQWKGLSALPARLAAPFLRPSIPHPGDDRHLRRSSAGVLEAQGTNRSTISHKL